ncbi:4-hydroxybenzoate 3-monooxygenase [Fodinicola acaciae]|uniref:4-hydroxybenzoate 3-monooxygenase n=1 Tax=Fodinicola acaciae TaxID=2681555 RepID=UPI0013D4308B|nr:4-hydroxybenzoate 3-monooxygenase [Fodinicola acaciae]
MDSTRTQVAVVGAGPAGLAVANLLRQSGIDTVLLEEQSRKFVEQRPRAGFIEEWAVRALDRHGLADQLLREAEQQDRFEFRFEGARHVVRYGEVVEGRHFLYPQQFLVADLVGLHTSNGGDARFQVSDVRLAELESARPVVTYVDATTGRQHRIDCDFVAGCDGAHGVTQTYFPAATTIRARHDYGIGWLAMLAEAPPSADCVFFGIHPRGFGAHMARGPRVTRFYLECRPGDTPENWPDDRVWTELHARLGTPDGPINEGPIFEKRVLDMHNYVTEPMSYGRLHLAGESAHVVAPIAAKGMNLAINDALLLAEAIAAYYRGDPSRLAGYSTACLRRVWQYQEFSQWLSDIFHSGTADPFKARLSQARVRRLLGSREALVAFAQLYLGIDADF